MGDEPSGYSGWFEHWADAQPDALAQIGDDGSLLTYAAIEVAANRVATAIDDLDPDGAFPVVVVGVEQGVDAIISMVAVAKTGRTQVPLDPGDPPARLAEVLGRLPPAVVLLRHAHDPAFELVDARRTRLLHLEEVPDDAPAERRARSVDPEALCVVVFTSGTTGVPKAAGRSFAAIDEILGRDKERWQGQFARHALVSDHQWLAGWTTIRRVLCAGGTLVRYSTRRRGPGDLARFLADQRVQHLGTVPSLVRAMLDADPVTRLPDLRSVTFTGDILHRDLVVALFDRLDPGARIQTSYGASELGGVARLTMDADHVPDGDIVPVGVPHDRVTVEIEDPGPDGVGRVIVVTRRGAPAFGTGDEHDESLERLADGRYRHLTSDLGLIRPDGMLEIRGRGPHMAKVRGQRIGVSEVEGALLAVPGIRDAGVGVHPDDPAGRLTAWYVAAPGTGLHVAQLRRQVRPRLPAFMVPTAFVPMTELPRGTRGKLLRDQLPLPGHGRPDLGYAYEAPVGRVEEVIADAFAQVLDVTPVGRDDELFDLGGDSLSAAEVMTLISAELGRDLPLSVFVEAGTPAQLAERLGHERTATDHSRLVALQPSGARPPVYCIHGGGGQVLSLTPLSERFGSARPFIGIQMRQSDKPRTLFRVNHLAERYAREIATRQGAEPCIVAGHSYGGVVAQEVSRRLVERGVPVELCILLDTSIPRRRLVAGRHRRARVLGVPDTMSTVKELLYAAHAAVGFRPTPHRLTTERMVAALWGMSWHRVRATPVPIVVVQAADAVAHHDLGGWQAHTSAGCTLLASAGGHNSMLGPPYVDRLAAVLAEQLERVEVGA